MNLALFKIFVPVYHFICTFTVCQLGYEPDRAGGCKTCDKDWFREDLSTSTCTACSTLDAAFVTNSTGADNSSLCRKLNFTKNVLLRSLVRLVIYRLMITKPNNHRNWWLKIPPRHHIWLSKGYVYFI